MDFRSADAVTSLITKGTTPAPADMAAVGDIPFLKVYNLAFNGRVDFSINPTYVTKSTHEGVLKRSRAYPGDLLLNIVGPPLGKTGVVPDSHAEWNLNQAIALIRPLPEFNRAFLLLWLMSPPLLSHFARRAKATAGQYNLTLEICKEMPIPLPPPSEQIEIVHRVSQMLRHADDLIARIQATTRRVDRSSQAILAKAFRGGLDV